jgi:hypothetical protein
MTDIGDSHKQNIFAFFQWNNYSIDIILENLLRRSLKKQELFRTDNYVRM